MTEVTGAEEVGRVDEAGDREPAHATSVVASVLLWPIVAYRRWISPALPPRCRFYPSCSAYAVEAISTRGVFHGLRLAVWRLLRCQPFNAGGYDPVPPRKNTEVGVRTQ